MDSGAILQRHATDAGPWTAQQRRAVADRAACRTAALGGRLEQCAACGHQHYHYYSCRNRHGPRCQAGRRAAWLEREAGWLLPVAYHHVVFTLPAALADLARPRPRLVYNLLFTAASASVLELAADPKYLGAQVGLVAVLHTWGQTLSLQPHVHVLATGGGLSCNRRGEVDEAPRWVSCRPGFFLPVRVLSRRFRGQYLAGLRQALEPGPWPVGPGLTRPEELSAWLEELYRQEWVVYSPPPAAGPAVVLKYLARYVQRVAISNSRLVAVTDAAVTFTSKDYRQGGRPRELTLSGAEFARRYLQPVRPRGLVRVRHYGLLANRGREGKLACCRRLLGVAVTAVSGGVAASSVPPPGRCPVCGGGVLVVVQWLPRADGCGVEGPWREDSS